MTEHVTFPDLPETLTRAVEDEDRAVMKNVLTPRGLKRRRVLIVGGAGYIGIPLTQHLLEQGFDVRVLDLLLYENHGPVAGFLGHPGYEFMAGDLCDSAARDAALDGISDVIILAGLVGDPITKAYPQEHEAINEDGLARFVDALNGRSLNKVVFVSTCSNYGEIPADTTADENFDLKPLSLYAKAKVAREQQLLAMDNHADFCGVVLRFATAFGLSGRMRFDLTVSEFTRDLHAGARLEVYDADTWRPYCHVRDFARALHRVLAFPRDIVGFEVFNAGGDVNNYTKKMIVDAIQDQVKTGEVVYVAGGADRRNYRVDFGKIRKALHFEPAFTVPDGVRELARALDQGFFADYSARPDFYRNNTITYPRD
ncbi:MAG: NAD-dependent epimerase/dehydratase [Magnetovibrio sp.]|nr:NAD-dependent epimerase/dehydratase [Magnetovibrio sp.]